MAQVGRHLKDHLTPTPEYDNTIYDYQQAKVYYKHRLKYEKKKMEKKRKKTPCIGGNYKVNL